MIRVVFGQGEHESFTLTGVITIRSDFTQSSLIGLFFAGKHTAHVQVLLGLRVGGWDWQGMFGLGGYAGPRGDGDAGVSGGCSSKTFCLPYLVEALCVPHMRVLFDAQLGVPLAPVVLVFF